MSAEAAFNAVSDGGGGSDILSFSGGRRYGAMAPKKGTHGHPTGMGPTSLFIFTEKNLIRRYTRFIIEWPYPFRPFSVNPGVDVVMMHELVYVCVDADVGDLRGSVLVTVPGANGE